VFVYLNDTDMVSSMFRRLTKEANLVDFHFHDLRHEAISRIVLYRRQLSIYEVMRMVGHTSLEMLNRYANLRGDELAVKFNQ
jgi:integrase